MLTLEQLVERVYESRRTMYISGDTARVVYVHPKVYSSIYNRLGGDLGFNSSHVDKNSVLALPMSVIEGLYKGRVILLEIKGDSTSIIYTEY